jgi:hypothetical protein
MVVSTSQSRSGGILRRVTCPHCWEKFSPERILWVSEHSDLLGDQRLGPDEQQRFLPTRFNADADAIDAKGFPCHHLACPKCHLRIPRALLEMEPLFLSIFGAPASGKSYYLAALTWELRKILGVRFALSFSDADPDMNRYLNEYEASLFVNADSDQLMPLAGLIRKTEEQGDLYNTVSYGNQTTRYSHPFLFNMQPTDGHPNVAKAERLGRTICLYDNAGESFQPGKDTAANPVTRHLARSRALFFVLDPTQDNRFRNACGLARGVGGQIRMGRQESVLQEAASRVRRHAKLRQSEKHKRPLIVILTKYDAWSALLQDDNPPEPWRLIRSGRVSDAETNSSMNALDVPVIERRSQIVRNVLLKLSPEIVAAAEGFAEDVTYVPVSAVGWKTEIDESTQDVAIRPRDTQPYWAAVPFLYALCRWSPGLIPSIARKK